MDFKIFKSNFKKVLTKNKKCAIIYTEIKKGGFYMNKDIMALVDEWENAVLDAVNMGILTPTDEVKEELLSFLEQRVCILFKELNEEEE